MYIFQITKVPTQQHLIFFPYKFIGMFMMQIIVMFNNVSLPSRSTEVEKG